MQSNCVVIDSINAVITVYVAEKSAPYNSASVGPSDLNEFIESIEKKRAEVSFYSRLFEQWNHFSLRKTKINEKLCLISKLHEQKHKIQYKLKW